MADRMRKISLCLVLLSLSGPAMAVRCGASFAPICGSFGKGGPGAKGGG